jgi:hypothetical protein
MQAGLPLNCPALRYRYKRWSKVWQALPDAGRFTCVSASSPTPLMQLSACALAHLGRHSDHPHRIPTTPRRSPKLCSDSQIRSNPIAHRVRRKRQRLSPSLLIENASDRGPRSPKVCPEAFPIEASDKSAITRLHRRRPFLPYKLKVFCRTANQTVHKLDNVHVKDNRAALRSRPTPAQQVESIT